MRTNYHTHTQRCRHAAGREEDYVRCAIEGGLSVLGFSDHAPFPDSDYGYRMPYEELEAYFSAVDRMKETSTGVLTVKKGLEIEYLPRYCGYYEQLLERYRPDYLLLGEHFYTDRHGQFLNITQAEDTAQYLDYAHAVAEGLRTGYFRMLAHPDLFAINRLPWDRNCDAATDIILEAAAVTDTVVEFNANGFRRGIHDYPDGRRYMYPHPAFWNKVCGSGIRVIVGSDCHEPQQVWDESMTKAHERLAALGITPLETFE